MMQNRQKILRALIKFFEDKGRVLSYQEYAQEPDTPVRVQTVKQVFGSWAKMEKLIMPNDNKSSGLNVDALIEARNKQAYEAAAQWKEASENQDKKAQREAEAQVVAETLARNAATPEGANANKIAIGGKLAHEQQDYSAMGTTVKVDPATLTQTVVDPKPEIVEASVSDDPKTPLELRNAVAMSGKVSGGDAPVDTSTAGGSTGEASIATTDALGKTDEKAPIDSKAAPKK